MAATHGPAGILLRRIGFADAPRDNAKPPREDEGEILSPAARQSMRGIFASSMTFVHLAISERTSSRISSGVLPRASPPVAISSAFFTAGSPSAERVSAFSLLTMSGGVPFGATSPAQVRTSYPLSPA